MDKKTLLTISLCFLIFFGWQKFYIEPRLPKRTDPAPTSAQTRVTDTPNTQTASAGQTTKGQETKTQAASPAVREFPVANGKVRISNGSQLIAGWELNDYRVGLAKSDPAIDLHTVTFDHSAVEFAVDRPELAYLSEVRGVFNETAQGLLWTYEDSNVKITRLVRVLEGQSRVSVALAADFKNAALKPNFAFLSLKQESRASDPEAHDRQLVFHTANSVERVLVGESNALQEIPTQVDWIGATNRYFMFGLIPTNGVLGRGVVQPLKPYAARGSIAFPVSGQSFSSNFDVFLVPKELGALRAVAPSLEQVVDFGWFTWIAYPLLKLMKWFYGIVGNWGVAIILLTILVKIVTFPLNYKSMKSMRQMAKVQPQLTALRDKYKDDKEGLNREMLTLMREHGYNPMAGCLPMLVQMPVFFALYRVLYSAIELYHAPFGLWIHDLSAQDPYYVTPILMTAVMWLQQKLTPMTITDPMQAKMMQLMPLIFGVFMLTLPSGLAVYMLVNAIVSIGQMVVLNKHLDALYGPLPKALTAVTPAKA